ncbi:MAG: ROK family protein [Methanosarcinales archaeon]|nr:ROK family protein [Methanosarcinales archaeon]
MTGPYLAGVDIGGTKITVSLANTNGISVKVYQNARLKGSHTAIPEQVDFLIGYACDQIRIQPDDIMAVGVSSCGPFTKEMGPVQLVAPNLCGGLVKDRKIIPNNWIRIPLESVLSRQWGTLKIENDAVAAVVAERLFGAGRGEDDLVYVTWSTGIGGGAYIDGRLIHGKNGNAPHIGHIYLAGGGPQCGCGNFGDMESLVSGVAIARDYGERGTAENVFKAYHSGDWKAKEIISKAIRNFARGLASINAILDTGVIVVGGSVFMNNIDILLPGVKDEFYRSFPVLSEGVDIRPSALGTYLGDMAALSLVMPDEWIRKWQENALWELAPPAVVLDR